MSVNLERRSGTERRYQNRGAATDEERRCCAEQRMFEFNEMFFSDTDVDSDFVKPTDKAETDTTEDTMDFKDRIRN
jgi:hypothetical protein